MIIEILLVVSLIQDIPNASVGWNVVWDHDGLNTDHYEINFDLTTWTITDMNKMYPIPFLPVGQHTVYVRACGAAILCSDPASLVFNLVTAPNPPTNIQIPPPTPLSVPRTTKPAVKAIPKSGVKK